MNDFLIGLAGHAFGLDDATLVNLETKDIPKIQELLAIYRKVRPDLLRAEQLFNEISPDVQNILKKIGPKT